jgi:RND family efflux transporter MFP subunit
MSGLNNILFSYDLSQSQENIDYYNDAVKNYDKKVTQYRDDAYNLYQTARAAYDKNFADYKAASRSSDNAAIESLINETYDTTKSIAEAVKSANNLIQFYEDQLTSRNLNPKAVADTHLASLNSYTGKTNTHLLNLLTIENTIQADKQAIINADRTISEKQASIAKLQAGTDALDIQTQELNIKQKENALLDAKEKLADYSIHAPFDGIVSKVDIKKGDSASTGTAVATMITEQQIAEVSLNEVDAAKVKVGQKATLTFDAVDNLSITGKVLEIDTIGTVSQGVVSYTVKIGFDTQDQRVKPGMSVSAAIVTDVKADVLAVPNSAVKSQNGQNYVEILNPDDQTAIAGASQVEAIAAPKQQTIEIGLANDTSTEIVSGLKQGDNVVIQTISPTTTTTTSSSSSGLRIPGLTGGGGGNFRGN